MVATTCRLSIFLRRFRMRPAWAQVVLHPPRSRFGFRCRSRSRFGFRFGFPVRSSNRLRRRHDQPGAERQPVLLETMSPIFGSQRSLARFTSRGDERMTRSDALRRKPAKVRADRWGGTGASDQNTHKAWPPNDQGAGGESRQDTWWVLGHRGNTAGLSVAAARPRRASSRGCRRGVIC